MVSELAAPSVELGSAMHRKTGMQEAAAHTARGVVAVERWEVGVKRGIAGRAGPDPQQLRYPGHDNNTQVEAPPPEQSRALPGQSTPFLAGPAELQTGSREYFMLPYPHLSS